MFKKLVSNSDNSYENEIKQKSNINNLKSTKNLTANRKYQIRKINGHQSHNHNQNNPYYEKVNSNKSNETTVNDKSRRYRFKSYDYVPSKQRNTKMESILKNSSNRYLDLSDLEYTKPYDSKIKSYQKTRSNSLHPNISNDQLNYHPSNRLIPNYSSDSSYDELKSSRFCKTKPNYRKKLNNEYRNNRNLNKCPNCAKTNQDYTKHKNVSFKNKIFDEHNVLRDQSLLTHSYSYSKPNYDNPDYATIYTSPNSDAEENNMLTIRSTYRKDENIPHSGTKLEHNRKRFDRFCSGDYNKFKIDTSNKSFASYPRISRLRRNCLDESRDYEYDNNGYGGFRKYSDCNDSDDSNGWRNCNNDSQGQIKFPSDEEVYEDDEKEYDDVDNQSSSSLSNKPIKNKSRLSPSNYHQRRYHQSFYNTNLNSKIDKLFVPNRNYKDKQSTSTIYDDLDNQVTHNNCNNKAKATSKPKKLSSNNKSILSKNNDYFNQNYPRFSRK